MGKSGIYSFLNKLDGTAYVGQAFNVEKRISQHIAALRRGDHRNIHLQRAFIRDGEPAFTFTVIQECPASQLTEREQYWIDWHKERGPVYNICPAGRSSLGVKRRDETRAKQSALKKGKPQPQLFTPEVRARAAKSHSAIWHETHKPSAEANAKRTASLLARWAVTPKKKMSDEAKQKMSESAKQRWITKPLTREAIDRACASRALRHAMKAGE